MEEKQLAALLKEQQDTSLNLCLSAAQAALDWGEFTDADRLYKRGLEWSEQRFGAQSAAVGLILTDMIKLYKKDGRNRSTKRLEQRLRAIYRRYFFKSVYANLGRGR